MARPQAYPGKLNLFQRMMLRWRELHPYNAVHVVHVAHAFDADDVRRCIRQTIDAHGIGGYTLDAQCTRYAYRDETRRPDLDVIAANDDADRALADEIARQLNRPFELGVPLRYFAVPMPAGFLLGVAYDHFIAGGDSVAALLGAIVARIGGVAPACATTAPLEALYPSTYSTLMRRHGGWFVRAAIAMPSQVRESKRAYRPRDRDPDDPRNAYALIRLAPTEVAALRGHALAFGVTLHDLIIAMLLRTLSPLAIGRRGERVRREISVAAIVNIRRDFGGDDARAFGQLLASMRVTHPVADETGLGDLARDVRRATLPIKRSHLYLRSLLGLSAASIAWRYMSPAQRRRFYVKHYPAWAGVSMMDIDPLWPKELGPATLYTRGVSTGPLTPAVLAISSGKDALSIGVAWRPTALPADFPALLHDQIRQCANQSHC